MKTDRQFVADLFIKILNRELLVREALEYWPKTTKDRSINAAKHAMIHYDVDIDQQLDSEYRKIQDDHIRRIIELFSENKDLPLDTLVNYENYYQYGSSFNILEQIKRILAVNPFFKRR